MTCKIGQAVTDAVIPRPIAKQTPMSLHVRPVVHSTDAPYLSLYNTSIIRRTSGRNMGNLETEHVDVTRMSSFYLDHVIKVLISSGWSSWWADEQQFPLMHTQEYGHDIRNCWLGQMQVITCLLTLWFFNNDTSMNAWNVIGYSAIVWRLLVGTAWL